MATIENNTTASSATTGWIIAVVVLVVVVLGLIFLWPSISGQTASTGTQTYPTGTAGTGADNTGGTGAPSTNNTYNTVINATTTNSGVSASTTVTH